MKIQPHHEWIRMWLWPHLKEFFMLFLKHFYANLDENVGVSSYGTQTKTHYLDLFRAHFRVLRSLRVTKKFLLTRIHIQCDTFSSLRSQTQFFYEGIFFGFKFDWETFSELSYWKWSKSCCFPLENLQLQIEIWWNGSAKHVHQPQATCQTSS